MVSKSENWIRIFDISDISKHKKGFTIYKIVSMLYPQTCPDAITKITVWKRYNDFKHIHREMKVLHRKLKLKDKYPSLSGKTYFKRFSDETLQSRRQSIQTFLEYIGSHALLFTSDEFVKFFESSHTPVEQLAGGGNITSIRATLNLLPEDAHEIVDCREPAASADVDSDTEAERTISDADSITTLNSLSISLQTMDFLPDPLLANNKGNKLSSTSASSLASLSHQSRNSDTISDSFVFVDGTGRDGTWADGTGGRMYLSPPSTPNSADVAPVNGGGGGVDCSVQYIVDASVHVNLAVELECRRQFEEAFVAYKAAIDILLKYGKDDKNFDRKQMVRHKTEKYLLRAEKLYNMYLAPEVKHLTEICEPHNNESMRQRPISDLYKYKVVKVIGSGMLVLHSETHNFFYIKVIHKTMKFLNENLILPENVPYMVKLYNYYSSENSFFLILEYASGLKLWDYIKRNCNNPDNIRYGLNERTLKDIIDEDLQDADLSDPEESSFEFAGGGGRCGSYSDLINDYANSKMKNINNNETTAVAAAAIDDDSINLHNNYNVGINAGSSNQNPIRNLLLMDDDANNVSSGSGQSQTNNLVGTSITKASSYFRSSENGIQNCVIPLEDVTKWAAQLLLALEKLHALGIICRNLQSDNLLIDANGDLTLTYMCNINDLSDVFNKGGPTYNLAPEVYSFEPVTKAVDWWCFGAILYELLVGMPLSVIHPNGLTSYNTLKIPKYVSQINSSLLKQLLVFEPHQRLGCGVDGIERLKSHPFFRSVSWTDLVGKYNQSITTS